MHRTAQPFVVADLLSDGDKISDLDQRLAGCADVLGHGDGHQRRRREGHDGLLAGQPLHIIGMHTAEE